MPKATPYTNLLMSDVRCFSGGYSIPIRPITVVIGENSTGKTTLLAALSSVLRREFFPSSPDLNQPPYDIGNFDTTATLYGGTAGRAPSFSIGLESLSTDHAMTRLFATYGDNFGVPVLNQLDITFAMGTILVTRNAGALLAEVSIQPSEGDKIEYTFAPDRLARSADSSAIPLSSFLFELLYRNLPEHITRAPEIAATVRRQLDPLLGMSRRTTPVVSIAPVRSRPQRTYDVSTDQFAPEGDHIPLLLAKIFDPRVASTKDPERLLRLVRTFGKDSGLFQGLSVTKLGRNPGDPFRLMIKTGTMSANITDVGYGVSQSLPVVVQSIASPKNTQFLIQQPEVHLHPRGQAALASLFLLLHNTENKSFTIETHSDHIVNRLRQHVVRGELDPADVQVLYLARTRRETEVYPIEIDHEGNLQGAPPQYRQFFIDEQASLWGEMD